MADSRIFLCHSSSDKPSVRQLYRRLLADGFRPWLDEEDLLPGQDWELEIRAAIHDSQTVVVCLSRESISKTGFVQREIRIALDAADERPEGSIYVIPARLEECQTPERLARWHWVDLYKDDGYRRLRHALSSGTPRANAIPASTTDAPARGSTDEQAETALAVISWQDADVRYDGVYVRKLATYSEYLTFYDSGQSYSVSATNDTPPEDVSRWFSEPDKDIAKGSYTILGDQIRIVTDASEGRVEYRGTVAHSSNELHLYSHSYINGHESFGVWRFHATQFSESFRERALYHSHD